MFYFLRLFDSRLAMARRMQHDIFFVSSKFSVGVIIGSGSVISVMGAKYRNHYAQIVMVGISATSILATRQRDGYT